MPAIVYKQLDIPVTWVQARRIVCEHCNQPYTYVVGEERVFSTTGVPILSSDTGMKKAALKQCFKAVKKWIFKPRQGAGLCPHCSTYQNWMVGRSRRSGICKGLFWGGLLGLIPGLICLVALLDSSTLLATVLLGGSVVACAALGVMIALKWSLTYGVQEEADDPRSMKDEAITELLSSSEEEELEPVLTWYVAAGFSLYEKHVNLSLGFWDEAGGYTLPSELCSDAVLAVLEEGITK